MKIVGYERRGDMMVYSTDSDVLPVAVYEVDMFPNLAAVEAEINKKIKHLASIKEKKMRCCDAINKELRERFPVKEVSPLVK